MDLTNMTDDIHLDWDEIESRFEANLARQAPQMGPPFPRVLHPGGQAALMERSTALYGVEGGTLSPPPSKIPDSDIPPPAGVENP